MILYQYLYDLGLIQVSDSKVYFKNIKPVYNDDFIRKFHLMIDCQMKIGD